MEIEYSIVSWMRRLSESLFLQCVQIAQEKPHLLLELVLVFLLTLTFPEILKWLFSPVIVCTAMFLTVLLRIGKQQEQGTTKDILGQENRETVMIEDNRLDRAPSEQNFPSDEVISDGKISEPSPATNIKEVEQQMCSVDFKPEVPFTNIKSTSKVAEEANERPLRKKSVRFSDKKTVIELQRSFSPDHLRHTAEEIIGRRGGERTIAENESFAESWGEEANNILFRLSSSSESESESDGEKGEIRMQRKVRLEDFISHTIQSAWEDSSHSDSYSDDEDSESLLGILGPLVYEVRSPKSEEEEAREERCSFSIRYGHRHHPPHDVEEDMFEIMHGNRKYAASFEDENLIEIALSPIFECQECEDCDSLPDDETFPTARVPGVSEIAEMDEDGLIEIDLTAQAAEET